MDSLDLVPGLKSDQEIQLDSVSVGENVDDPTVVAPAVEEMPLQNIDTEDNVLWKKEEARSKEEHLSNGSLRTSKRKSSFPNESEYVENGTHAAPVQPRQPSYMAATESAKAKLRAQNSPRLDSDSSAEKNGFTRRHSLPSSTKSKFELTHCVYRHIQGSRDGVKKVMDLYFLQLLSDAIMQMIRIKKRCFSTDYKLIVF